MMKLVTYRVFRTSWMTCARGVASSFPLYGERYVWEFGVKIVREGVDGMMCLLMTQIM
jgi:hypothetical protein